MNRADPARPILITAAVTAGIVGIVDLAIPLRSVLVVGFLVLGPGAALVRIIGIRDLPSAIAVTIAASVAISTIVATIVLYAGVWSPRLVLAIVALMTIAIVAAHRPREPQKDGRRWEHAA